jgi:hypothetical protein
MKKRLDAGIGLTIVLLLAALIGAGYQAWRHFQRAKPDQAAAAAPVTIEPAASAAAATAPAGTAVPAVRHPIVAQPATAASAAQAEAAAQPKALRASLDDLLGAPAVLSFVAIDNLIPRVVVTVDNLAREHAPARLWPVHPVGGRFSVVRLAAGDAIGPGNAERYEALVRFLEGIDTARAVALYMRLYPQFQRAYEELGYPGRYFNDRLVEVIDHLLAAPAAAQPVGVSLLEVRGPIPSTRPWTRYEFADAALQNMSAGHKVLVRVGPQHALRLKAKLAEFRRALLSAAPAR